MLEKEFKTSSDLKTTDINLFREGLSEDDK